jgi:Fic family protein
MSRAYLNYEVSPDLQQRRDRRKRFRERFLQLPLGMFSSAELALDTGIPWRTALAYLQELRREGLVNHNIVKRNKYGLKLDTPVWSRVK